MHQQNTDKATMIQSANADSFPKNLWGKDKLWATLRALT